MTAPRLRQAFAGLTLAALVLAVSASGVQAAPATPERRERVEALISKMTLEEKAGQLDFVSIVPVVEPQYGRIAARIEQGEVGGLYNVHGAAATRALQDIAVNRTRLGIPLLLALDVVHGYRTIFPTPLGQAATWDMAAIETAERVSTAEAAAGGINMVFAPMLDVSRDARWGRVVEGLGESPWLGAKIAAARVRGVEGSDLRSPENAAGCAKHLGANGAVEGGRDYTGSDLSERGMRETYLPPFEAAAKAGVRCFMAAFNAPDGVPTILNRDLLTDTLRGEWGFDGVVISDFEAIMETTLHGVSADLSHAAEQAIGAGADMDMQSGAYVGALPDLVRNGKVEVAVLDEAVRRVLTLKDDLGLFDDPFRGGSPEKERAAQFTPETRKAAQEVAEKSFVLLKNEGEVLPFRADVARVALIGPLGDSAADTLGPWAARGEPHETVTLKDGLEQRLGRGAEIAVTHGGTTFASTDEEIAAAVETARRSEVVVLAVGERFNQSGEAATRADLALPGDQEKLVRAVLAVGKPTVVVVFAGRPLVLTSLAEKAPAILYAWQPGTMGGLALARVVMGDVAPEGRLPMSFPAAVGQIPIHHDQRPTGRPATLPQKPFTTGYSDVPHGPLYPFGFGLTYATFSFGEPELDRTTLRAGETATVKVQMQNTGRRTATAVAQLYLRPKVASVSRPLKVLRGYARVALEPGEIATVELPVTEADIGYWKTAEAFGATAGPIEIMTGPDAGNVQTVTLEYRP